MAEPTNWEERLRQVVSWIAVVGTSLFAAGTFYVLLNAGFNGAWNEVTLQHLPSIVGLPSAAIASLGLVLLLRTIAGNIETKFFGFEFKGLLVRLSCGSYASWRSG
jgi:hypothetical protein